MEKAIDDEVRLRSKRRERVGLPWGGGGGGVFFKKWVVGGGGGGGA